MAVFLGVSRTLALLDGEVGDAHFWCVGGASSTAKPGDQILLYFPVSVSRSKAGIGQVYHITSLPRKAAQSRCNNYGMAEVDMCLQLTLRNHIKISDMKADSILQNWGAIKRSMQGVTFAMNSEQWTALRAMIIEKNPDAEIVLNVASSSEKAAEDTLISLKGCRSDRYDGQNDTDNQ